MKGSVVQGARLSGFRLVTLCGSAGSMHDAMRDSQDLIEPMLAQRGIDVRPVDLGDWSIPSVPALLREIARHRPDGILMQYPTGAFGRSLGPIAIGMLQRSAPMMVMLHEFVAAHPARKAAVGGLLLRAKRIGITADRERDALCRVYPWLRGRIRDVPIASNIPGRDWAPDEPARVVYFGQFRPEKGIEEFFACSDLLRGELPGVSFHLIGTAVPNRPEYAEFVIAEARRRGIGLDLGLDPDRVADALSSATVALLPYPDGASFRRGTLFAAASCGVPVVTTVGEDTPPALRDLLCAGVAVDDTVALVRQLTAQPDMLQRAHRQSVELNRQFGWDKTIDHYIATFREMADVKSTPMPGSLARTAGATAVKSDA